MQYDTHTFTILKYPGIVDPRLSAPPAEKMEKCNLWMNYNQLNPHFTKTMNQQKNTMSQAIKTNRSIMMIIHTSGRTLIGPVHLHYLGETTLQKPRRLDDKSTPFSSIEIDGSKEEWRTGNFLPLNSFLNCHGSRSSTISVTLNASNRSHYGCQ